MCFFSAGYPFGIGGPVEEKEPGDVEMVNGGRWHNYGAH
jgi:hypothetical protein